MDNSQIESTINEIRKRSGAITAFNEDNLQQKYGKNPRQNHSVGKWNFGESNHQKNHFTSWSKNIGRFLLNEKKIQSIKVSALNPLVYYD